MSNRSPRILPARVASERAREPNEDVVALRPDGLTTLHREAQRHGYEQGLKHCHRDLAELRAEFRRASANPHGWLEQFVFGVVAKLLGEHEADVLVPALLAKVIQTLDVNVGNVRIHVNPGAADAVVARFDASGKSKPAIDVVADCRLGATDCEIHTNLGVIEASLDVQLAALAAVLSDSMPDTNDNA